MLPKAIDNRQSFQDMGRPSWNGQTLKTAQRTWRYHADIYPSGIYDGTYGLQKIGHK